jgi:hydrogenase maturation protein HypF
MLDLLPLLGRLADGVEAAVGAGLFHGTLIAALVEWVAAAASARNLQTAALSGGCFLNKVLTEGVVAGLAARGLKPLVARAVPPNDGGLSLGQAFIAAMALSHGEALERAGSCVTRFR